MGYLRHHAIVLTCWNAEHIAGVHAKATEWFGPMVSNMVEGVVNEQHSFLIGPDGSKEFWDTSDEHDTKRAAFKAWLRGSSTYVEWTEIVVGGDDDESCVVDHGGWWDTDQGKAEIAGG